MLRFCLCLGAVLAVVLASNSWILSVVRNLYNGEDLYWARPEPAGLGEELRKIPVPQLSEEDLRVLKEDGVVVVRGLVPDKDLLKKLAVEMWPHTSMKFADTPINQKHWLYNGAVRALLRDGPLGAVLAQTGKETKGARVWESPVWGYRAKRGSRSPNMWHADSRAEDSKRDTTFSVWLVMTDAADGSPLEFLRGSHKYRQAMEDECAHIKPGGKNGFKEYTASCVDEWQPKLEKELSLNGTALLSPTLQAGDAFLFTGDVLHRGVRHPVDRLAISVRTTAAAMSRAPEEKSLCDYRAPFIYPAKAAQTSLGCMPWVLLPSLPRESPWFPASDMGHSVIKLVNKVVG